MHIFPTALSKEDLDGFRQDVQESMEESLSMSMLEGHPHECNTHICFATEDNFYRVTAHIIVHKLKMVGPLDGVHWFAPVVGIQEEEIGLDDFLDAVNENKEEFCSKDEN